MLLVIGIHAALTVLTAALTPRVGPKAFLLAALAPASGVVLLAASAADVLRGGVWTQSLTWVPGLDLAISLRLDGLSWLMLVLVSGIGTVIFGFCAWYAHRDPTLTRFVATLTAFAGAMAGLVLSDDVLLLYVFWELTSVTSFLLVGLKTDDEDSRRAALQALLITMLGGLAMLVGLLILADAVGSTSLTTMLQRPPAASASVQAGLALVLLGALTKSAQVPFHIWLPAAMAAPTPVSAYLHAAAMVKAGVYLIARLSPTFADDVTWWRPVLVAFGVSTMILGGWRALRQHDLKRLLAFSTVSQLGFLTVVAGWGGAATAVALLLLAHGLAKSALFLSLGALDHQSGTRDLRELTGVGGRMPVLATAAIIAALSMAGVPPLLGFVAKEEVLTSLVHAGRPAAVIAVVGVVIGSALTFAYALRFCWGAFAPKNLAPDDPDAAPAGAAVVGAQVTAPVAGMTVPVALLSTASLGFGLMPALLDSPVGAVSGREEHLALWHGLNPALGLSVLALTAGAALFAVRRRLFVVQRRFSALFAPDSLDADLGYDRSIRAVNRISAVVTGHTQVGSLTSYLGVIVSVAIVMPGAALLLLNTPWYGAPLLDVPADLPVGIVIAVAALFACLTRTRLTAVLLLGAVGYGVAALFAFQGAPDLAMTQLLVETLSLVVFLFVLRLLPTTFTPPPHRAGTRARAALAGAVGVLAALLTLLATNPNRPPSVAESMLADSYPEGHGRNVVNVILVDFRGLDTLGEATVVLVAALGILLLVTTARRPTDEAPPTPRQNPSMLLRASVRVMFYPILATAGYLLFAGHNNPGGGFIGGLVAGSAFVLRYLSGDVPRASAPLAPVKMLALGLALAAGDAIVPMLAGGDVLTSGYLSLEVPLLGTVALTSVLVFDTGVFLIVLGITLVILDTLGSRPGTSLGVVTEEVKL